MPGEVLKLPRPFLTMGFGSAGEPQPQPQSDHQPQRKEMSFCEGPCHAEQILQVLNAYRRSGTFTDVVLQVDSSEFPCHRAILSAGSIYFRTMFNGQLLESRQQLVRIQGVGASTMETVLNFVYEGKAALDEGNVGSVFSATNMLGVSVLSKACVRFLEERMDHSNCLGIMDFASSYFITPLADKCQTMLYRDFVEVYKHEEFLSLAKERVVELLTSEQLQVDKEEVLVEAVLKWVHHVPAERKGALQELLELVRLPLVDPVFFVNVIESDDLVQDCRECRPLLQEARMYHVLGREVDSVRTRPRKCMGRAEMIVVIGGCDRNGFSRLSFTEKLNPYTKEWVPGATIPGYSKSEFASCELQNEVDHWVRVASLAKARWRHKMVALLGKLYAVGGFNGLERLSNVECYSVYDNQWRTVAPLLLAVSSAALVGCSGKLYRCINAITHNNTIYVVGGLLDQIYSYTPKTDTWSKVVDLPMKLVYIVGGRDSCASATDQVWAYCPESGKLTDEKPMSRNHKNDEATRDGSDLTF
ncbi:unnamed protein product [Coregonus sp. 'balchen']|nr:unnamed protein product [Coregonus sp. 'balchen']